VRGLFLLLLAACSSPQVKEPTIEEIVEAFPDKIYFTTSRKEPWVIRATKDANCVMNLKEFRTEVESIGWFSYSEDTGDRVAANLFAPAVTSIDLHTFLNPWTSAVAVTFPDQAETIYFNARKNARKREAYVGSAIHERSHLPPGNYSHPFNHTIDRPSSVPYKLGELAAKYAPRCF